MAIPSGTQFILPIKVNKTMFTADIDNFLYCIDLSSKLTQLMSYTGDDDEKKYSVYDPLTDTLMPKYIDNRSIADGKLFIYFNGPGSSTIDRFFFICVGSGITENNNSTTAFSLSGFTHYFGFNEIEASSTTLSYIGGVNGTVSANASVANTGKFYKCARNTGSGTGLIDCASGIIGSGDRTFEYLFNLTTSTSGRIFTNSFCSLLISSSYKFSITRNGTTYVSTNSNSYTNNVWYHAAITSTSDGTTNFYINGIQSGTPNQSAGTPSSSGTVLYILNRAAKDTPTNGYLDELGFTNNILSTDYIKARYNQYFNSSFATIENGIVLTDQDFYRYGYRINY